MEFHVWDFSRRIEVRLSDEMINRIRSMTTEKRMLIKQTRLQMSPGWKQPLIRKPYYQVKTVKLIAHSDGHPLHKIAERLYPKHEWHGEGRNSTPHKPYINIGELETVQTVTAIPREELECSVTSVRNRDSGLEVGMKFPVATDESWAWLFGCYFSCGGLVTRDRIGKDGYLTEERLLRLILEKQVFERKVSPILERIGYSCKLKARWYVKYGGHKLDRGKRVGVGNQPRMEIYLPRVLREVMQHFGLYMDIPKQGRRHGRRNSSRTCMLRVPDWVKQQYPRQFIEGFINGGQVGSQLKPLPKGIIHMVELRAGFRDPMDAEALISFFREELGKLGVTGTLHRIVHRDREPMCWLGFTIFAREPLVRLFKNFDIQQPVLRARLTVVCSMNQLLYEVCRRMGSNEILLIGALLEGPRTHEELRDMFRLRDDQVARSLEKLGAAGFVVSNAEQWRMSPAGAKDSVLRGLAKQDEERRRIVWSANERFYSRCPQCGNVIPQNHAGKCGCGDMLQPVERFQVLRRYRQRNGSKIARILQEAVPQGGL